MNATIKKSYFYIAKITQTSQRCEKLVIISLKGIEKLKYILLYSVVRLLNLLTCYNPKHSIAIGERYGFRMWDSHRGYQFLTGGAGVVLSAPLVHLMIEPGVCTCPSAITPDDMYLFGLCLLRLGVEGVHSSMFHQVCVILYIIFFFRNLY